ncbi:hypothetical protein THMIRHAS_11960 [Thiosulfatimonas sediminis]|uniref:Uncharacterized protein n=1 Tax=Thiosulfatimonas sediminis TaxID=2675054 RepID=A0A6F8PUK8_9GAMM|nr:hypothetical protein [Thiosulfatimonas sediminis]BBP45823.1 hypothetical protein THMIRHAS_11960 [Thiosulfatimonas sediminis]
MLSPWYSVQANSRAIDFTHSDYVWIGERIYHNETGRKPENLLFWSPHEPFPSLGIGHFIWFPENLNAPFEQTFPSFIRFVKHRHPQTSIPVEFQSEYPPWKNREAFTLHKQRGDLAALRLWLIATMPLQAEYIVQRFDAGLPEVLAGFSVAQQIQVSAYLHQLMQTKNGLFSLIDYSNFKGFGSNPIERYQQQGWGLLQVLEQVLQALDQDGVDVEQIEPQQALTQFIAAAKATLAERVALAPPEKNEARWLPGWQRRLEAYGALTPN